jgi:hypothetical protein
MASKLVSIVRPIGDIAGLGVVAGDNSKSLTEYCILDCSINNPPLTTEANILVFEPEPSLLTTFESKFMADELFLFHI